MESAEVNFRAVTIWDKMPSPSSDHMLPVLQMNQEVQHAAMTDYMAHVEAVHRTLESDTKT